MMPNEVVEEKAKKLSQSMEGQYRIPCVGALHIFIMADGAAITLDYIPPELKTKNNLQRLAGFFSDWAKAVEVDE